MKIMTQKVNHETINSDRKVKTMKGHNYRGCLGGSPGRRPNIYCTWKTWV